MIIIQTPKIPFGNSATGIIVTIIIIAIVVGLIYYYNSKSKKP